MISTRFIKNKSESIINISKNDSKVLNYRYLNNRINRPNIVKYRFLQSQKNYYKRMNNLKENNFPKKSIINLNSQLNQYKKSKSMKEINNIFYCSICHT